jgi:peptidoglycan-associated lipoprotein
LTPNNQEQLTAAVPCFTDLLKDGGELILEAHADNVGGEEYNILLTDRRGTSVRDFLANMGVNNDQMRVVGKGALEAKGSDESSRSKDRRVQFIFVAP